MLTVADNEDTVPVNAGQTVRRCTELRMLRFRSTRQLATMFKWRGPKYCMYTYINTKVDIYFAKQGDHSPSH